MFEGQILQQLSGGNAIEYYIQRVIRAPPKSAYSSIPRSQSKCKIEKF